MRKRLACECGARQFKARLELAEQVGLLTCAPGGHHSLLLDSRDHWSDVLQAGRPREVTCRCGGHSFEVELAYQFREDSESIRRIEINLHCVACGDQRVGATFEIDYEPTQALFNRPLDPISDPWLKARQTVLSALWLPTDLAEVVHYIEDQDTARCYFAGWQERPRRLDATDVLAAVAGARSYDLFFAVRDIAFPGHVRDAWRQLPVIHVPAPIHMNYRTGKGTLYYLEWADERLVDGRIVAGEETFLDFSRRFRSWLESRFTSERGSRTVDNRGEFNRLVGGWA